MNLPNRLTVARLGLTVVFVMALLLPHFPWGKTVALVVFALAGITDWLDGRIARQRNLETNFGALLDPVADKVLTSAAFICFIEQPGHNQPSLVQAWMALVIVSREFLVTGLRLVAQQQGVVLKAERLGKHKTASQMVTIMLVLIGLAAREDWGLTGDRFSAVFAEAVFWLMIVTVALTVWSGFAYFWKNREIVVKDA